VRIFCQRKFPIELIRHYVSRGISAAVTTNVSLRAFDTDTKKWVLLGGGARMYYALQFPTLSVPRNNSSCAVFRKEKDREFPPSSRLESYQLT